MQKALDNRQVVCGLFAQPDEKIADAIQALDLISASLIITVKSVLTLFPYEQQNKES